MGVSVAACPTSGRRNFEFEGSAEYKLRLFRPSLRYLGCPSHPHSFYSPYSFYLRLLLNGKDSSKNRNFLFIDMQQVAILKVDTSYMYPSLVTNRLFRMDVDVCARSANIFTTFIFSFSNPVFLQVNVPSLGLIQVNFPVSYLSLPALILKWSYCLPRYQMRRQETYPRPCSPKRFARSLKNISNLA